MHYNIITGESGLVYRAYLNSGSGRDMVAVKTCKGMTLWHLLICSFSIIHLALSLENDKEKLLKEMTTMLSFKHPNVMSLIGVCFDGEIPLIILPYMSNGSVLGYVKQNKKQLFLDSHTNVDEV